MPENSSDAVSLRLVALLPGLVSLEGYVLAPRYLRKRGWQRNVLPDGFVPTVAACLFGVGSSRPGPALRAEPELDIGPELIYN
jgi:hypothetical protein